MGIYNLWLITASDGCTTDTKVLTWGRAYFGRLRGRESRSFGRRHSPEWAQDSRGASLRMTARCVESSCSRSPAQFAGLSAVPAAASAAQGQAGSVLRS